jgi:hypothetical protein
MEPFNWVCPFCNHAGTITEANWREDAFDIVLDSSDGSWRLRTYATACPNQRCRKLVLQAELFKLHISGAYLQQGASLQSFSLVPRGISKPFPSYIPEQLRNDYKEACDIRDLSPKASATLCRRCLQGMIRDFWGITKSRLKDEIDALESKIDPGDWEAIDAVRKIGNIGAHMEKDVNLIVDVEPEEAQLLIGLIETLFEDWYVTREQKAARNKSLKELAEKKDAERKGTPAEPPKPDRN